MKIEIKNTSKFSFTSYEENFLVVLQTHALFEKFVYEIRKLFGLPKVIEIGKRTPVLDEHKKEMLKAIAVLLVGIYKGLPEEWHEIFAGIIMTGIASPLKSNGVSILFEDNSFAFNESDQLVLKIAIHKKMKFNQMIELINSRKSEIDKLLRKLPSERDTKTSYINIIQELIKIKKENPKKPHKDIVKIYAENFSLPLPTTLIDYNSFNTYYDRYKKMRAKLLKTNPQGIKNLKSTLFTLQGRV